MHGRVGSRAGTQEAGLGENLGCGGKKGSMGRRRMERGGRNAEGGWGKGKEGREEGRDPLLMSYREQ